MTGFSPLFRIDMRMIWRTWHRWVLPLLLVFLALLSVVTARFAPEILRAVMGNDISTNILPTATWQESYAQWMKNLGQIGIFVVIFSGAGATSQLISSGQAALLAVRPIARAAQPAAAFTSRTIVVVVSTTLSTGVMWCATCIIFPGAHLRPLLSSTGWWLATALIFLALSVGLSALVGSTLGAAGITIGVYLALAIVAAFPRLAEVSPAGILSAPPTFIGTSAGSAVLVPYLSAALVAALVLGCGMWRFDRREL